MVIDTGDTNPTTPAAVGRAVSGVDPAEAATAAEPLAQVLRSVGVEIGYAGAETYRRVVAERILADPGPLLEALVEAGVLREWREQFVRDGYGEAPLSVLGEVSEPYWKSCYVTEWQEVQP